MTLTTVEEIADALGGAVKRIGEHSAIIAVGEACLRLYFDGSVERYEVTVYQPHYTNNDGREEVYGVAPGANPKITMAAHLPARRLAGDIRNRILPHARELSPKWQAGSEILSKRSAQTERFRALCEALGGRRNSWGEVNGEITIGHPSDKRSVRWKVEDILGDSATMKLHGVSPAMVEQVVFLLNEWLGYERKDPQVMDNLPHSGIVMVYVKSQLHAKYLANYWALLDGRPVSVVLFELGYAVARDPTVVKNGTVLYTAEPAEAKAWLAARHWAKERYHDQHVYTIDLTEAMP